MTKLGKSLMFGGAVALALAGMSTADAGGWRDGRGHAGGYGQNLFEAFDTNGDGRLTQAEIDQARQSKLAEFDQNGDGSLSLEEYEALWIDAMREHMVDRFQAHDDDGDGQVTEEEFAGRFSRMVSRLDRDGDGEITQDELSRRGGERGRGRN